MLIEFRESRGETKIFTRRISSVEKGSLMRAEFCFS